MQPRDLPTLMARPGTYQSTSGRSHLPPGPPESRLHSFCPRGVPRGLNALARLSRHSLLALGHDLLYLHHYLAVLRVGEGPGEVPGGVLVLCQDLEGGRHAGALCLVDVVQTGGTQEDTQLQQVAWVVVVLLDRVGLRLAALNVVPWWVGRTCLGL